MNLNEPVSLQKGQPIVQFEIGSFQNFIYLLLDWQSQKAAIVDPQKDLSEPLAVLKEQGFELTAIMLTHTHHDHVAGVAPLLALYPNLELWVGERDLHRLPKTVLAAPGLRVIQDESSFKVGQIQVEPLLTPGHSAGAVSYFIPVTNEAKHPYVFTGDTIFIQDCGRTDLETGSNEEMFASIQKIKKLPKETVVLVGHHYAKAYLTTLQDEINTSPPFQSKSVAELSALP